MKVTSLFFHIFFILNLIIVLTVSIKYAWFPSENLLVKYPKEINYSFNKDGIIDEIFYTKGDTVVNGDVLVRMYDVHLDSLEKNKINVEQKFKILDRALINSIKNGASEKSIQLLTKRRNNQLEELNIIKKKIKLIIPSLSLIYENEFSGKISHINFKNDENVIAGKTVLTIRPYESFYLINKIISFIIILLFSIYIYVNKKFVNS
tara:strand:- start:269 stop:886 length:618 start_codon:yes stop_codon:yes gene_type:complete